MGYSSYSDGDYTSRRSTLKSAGKTDFNYTDKVIKSTPHHLRKVHEKLDPKGVKFRESRDSAEHPTSNPVAVFFDETGSMGHIPRTLQTKLPALMGILLRKGYLLDPQILFGAVGDGYSDIAPLQVGQFESGIEMDETFEHMWLEGSGGGGNHESYDLALYFMARHTVTDSWEKRGKPGYLFLIGDELHYPAVDRKIVEKVIGDTLQDNISFKDIAEEVSEKWNTFFICMASSSYSHAEQEKHKEKYSEFFPERVIILDDPNLVCETIVGTIGLNEGIGDIINDLVDTGTSLDDAKKVKNALAVPSGKSLAVDLPSGGNRGTKTL